MTDLNNNPFSFWDSSGKRNEDYYFHDQVISEYYDVNGLGVLAYLYIGPVENESKSASNTNNATTIQDFLYLENRDKQWNLDAYELRAIYTPQDAEFDLRQFGIFLDNDTMYITVHYNDMIRKLGRKIMTDDIIEFPNLRDYNPLDENAPSIPKLYIVTDSLRAADSFGPTWYYHAWRIKLKPLVASQETNQFLNGMIDDQTGFNLNDIISTFNNAMGVSDEITQEALADVPHRNFQTQHFYIIPGDEMAGEYPWIYAGDGVPPDGATLAATGNSFPENVPDGSWFLHTGFDPNILYRKNGSVWKVQEIDYSRNYVSAHRILESFINNKNITTLPGNPFTTQSDQFPEQQYLSKAITPTGDFKQQTPINTDETPLQQQSFSNTETDTKVRRKKIKPKADIS